MNKQVAILGVNVDAITIAQAIDQIAALAKAPGASYVTKPYVEFMEQAYQDPAIRSLLNNSALVLPDGVALQWAAYYQTLPRPGIWQVARTGAQIVFAPGKLKAVIPERFAGVDTTWRLLQHCADEGLKVFLIGSPKGSSIDQTAAVITAKLPELPIVGTHPGELSGLQGQKLYDALAQNRIDLQPLAAAIHQSRADIILTGMGFPQQDVLNARLAQLCRHGVFIGEGGSFDYASFGGQVKRAPGMMRRLGLEWLWRLIIQPSRWRRQLAIPRFIWHVYQESKAR